MQSVSVIAVVFGALENLIHAGVIFGWPSLVFVLKDIGYYGDRCPEDSTPTGGSLMNATAAGVYNTSIATSKAMTMTMTTSDEVFCEEQDAALVLVYTVATVILPLSMLPAGYLLLLTGSRISRIVFSLMMIGGYVCITLSSPDIPGLLYPAAILLGAAGIIIILASFEIANLFPSQKSTVIGVMNGCYDTSTIIFFLVKIAYENEISLEISSLVLAVSTVFFGVNMFILPRDHIPWPLPDNYRLSCSCSLGSDVEHDGDSKQGKEMFPSESKLQTNCSSCSVGTQTFEFDNHGFEDGNVSQGKKEVSIVHPEEHRNDTCKREEVLTESTKEITLAKRRESAHEHDAERKRDEAYPTFFSCLKCPMFFFMSFWAIVIQLQLFFVLGIMNPWLTWLAEGDLDVVSQYTNVLALMCFVSLIGGPLGGLLLDRRKLTLCSSEQDSAPELAYGPYTDLRNSWLAVTLTTLMSLAYSVCMLVRILPLQYLTFALLTLCRSMLYGVSAGVVPLTFPMRYYGIVYGMTYLLIGVCGSLQYPLFILIQNVLMGDPTYVIVGFIVANLLTFSYPAYIIYHVKKKVAMESN